MYQNKLLSWGHKLDFQKERLGNMAAGVLLVQVGLLLMQDRLLLGLQELIEG